MMELTLIYPPLADIVYDTRSVVIGFLHLTFLGFISIFIFAQFGLVKIFDFSKKGLLFGISLFIIGFFFNEITLFASGLRSEEQTSELQSRGHLVCRLMLGKKKDTRIVTYRYSSS